MLVQMTPDEFDERFAANLLDPIDASWQQASVITSEIVNAIQYLTEIVYQIGSGGKKLDLKPIELESYVPQMDYKKAPACESQESLARKIRGIANRGNHR